MLLPFQFAILTREDAKVLTDYLLKSVGAKASESKWKKLQELGISEIYSKLEEFLSMSYHYDNELHSLDSSDFQRKEEF